MLIAEESTKPFKHGLFKEDTTFEYCFADSKTEVTV